MKNISPRMIVALLAGLLVTAICNVAVAFPGRGGSCTTCHSSPGGSLTASPDPFNIQLGESGLLTFSITSLGGSDNTAISVQGLQNPALLASIAPGGDPWTLRSGSGGTSYVSNNITSTGPYTLNLAIGNLATLGTYPIVVEYAGDGERGTESGFTLQITAMLAAADFNEDGFVNGADLTNWQGGYGLSGTATHMQGDADGDLDVDGRDFLTWQREFGGPPAFALAIAVPEPTTAFLLLLGCTAVGTFTRCRMF